MHLRTTGIPTPALLLEVLGSVSQGVLVAGADRRILFCNEAFSQITGFVAEDIVGQSCSFTQGPGTDPRTIAAIRHAIGSERAFDGEILNYRKDGEPFWNELSISPVHDADRQLTHFIGIIRDVTALKNAEIALIASAERQCYLLDHIAAGIVIHSPTTEILYANAAATILLGVPDGRLLGAVNGDPRWTFVREDGALLPVAEFPVNRAVMTGSIVKNLVIGLLRPDRQRPTWLMCNAFPVVDSTGTPTEVVVCFTDITELKAAEQALQRSEERLRLVLQGSSDAAWDWDVATDQTYYSLRWWGMLGYQPDELQSDADLWIRLLHPDDTSATWQRLRAALATQSTSFELEFRLLHKAGHHVPILSRGFILRDDHGNAIRVSGTNTDLTERKAAEARINQLAFYDALTTLPNRRLLTEQLHKALLAGARSGRQGALLFIDIDNFKVLNDTMGHDRGDQLLQQVAQRLRECVREADTVARLGGDEFVVMLEHLGADLRDAAIEAEYVGKKILAALDVPFMLGDHEHCTSASIGIALFNDGTQGVEGVLKQADLAMYQAKAMGRNTLRNFDTSMQTAIDERLAMENDLRKGLALDEFLLYYQAQVDAVGKVIGAEVLLRWQNPARGLVLPATFIPLAETTNLILPLGKWVVGAACAQLAAWSHDPMLCELTLSVNVSVRQFREPDFTGDVLGALAHTGADPAKLKLELTESLIADNIDDLIEKMNALKARGVGFSLDDFGTGYSSLRYLQRLPLDELKIDRSFVNELLTNPNDQTIARAIISLAEKLGLAVIAEGVETESQRQFLYENGCRAYQGYLFGKPQPCERFEAVTRRRANMGAANAVHAFGADSP